MSRVCELTGVGPFTGNNVSHSHVKTRRRWLPNLKKKKYVIPAMGDSITVTLSSRAIRTIDKQGGITPAILEAKESLLSERLLKVRRLIQRQRKAQLKAK